MKNFQLKNNPDELNDRLKKAVNYRKISDVPIGAFLSGGIDSSMICALFQQNSVKPINTFTIGFEEKTHDESLYAEKVSSILNSKHHLKNISNTLNIDNIIKKVERFDEPFAAPSLLPTSEVTRFARNKVTVAMSGDGGDELFMGYGYYKWHDRLSRINKYSSSYGYYMLKKLLLIGNNKYKRISRLFNSTDNIKYWHNSWSEEQYMFSLNEISNLILKPENTNCSLNNEWKKIDLLDIHPYEKIALFDLDHYLPDNLLYKMDIASMSSSLEVRVPFLDHEFVEYALNLEKKHKINEGEQKYILKKVSKNTYQIN